MKHASLFAVVVLAGCTTAAAISADIATACSDALPTVNAVAPIVSVDPMGAMVVGSIRGACTVNGMVQMTMNDALPVTATNSGASAMWVVTTAAFAQDLADKLKPTTAK